MGHEIEPGQGSEWDELLRSYSVVAPKCMEGRRLERLREGSRLENGRPQG